MAAAAAAAHHRAVLDEFPDPRLRLEPDPALRGRTRPLPARHSPAGRKRLAALQLRRGGAGERLHLSALRDPAALCRRGKIRLRPAGCRARSRCHRVPRVLVGVPSRHPQGHHHGAGHRLRADARLLRRARPRRRHRRPDDRQQDRPAQFRRPQPARGLRHVRHPHARRARSPALPPPRSQREPIHFLSALSILTP